MVKHKKIELNFLELLRKIEISRNFVPISFDFSVLKLLPEELDDIHDQIIVATAKLLNAKLITKDKEIRESKLVEVVW